MILHHIASFGYRLDSTYTSGRETVELFQNTTTDHKCFHTYLYVGYFYASLLSQKLIRHIARKLYGETQK